MVDEKHPAEIQIVPQGEAWVFRKIDEAGVVNEIPLSEEEIFALSVRTLALQAELLEHRSRTGAQVVAVLTVAGTDVQPDLYNMIAILTYVDADKNTSRLGFPLDIAKPLIQKLQRVVDQIEESISKRTNQ